MTRDLYTKAILSLAALWLAACAGTGDRRAEAPECRNCGEIVAIDSTRLVERGVLGTGPTTLADRRGRLLQAPDLSALPSLGSALANPTAPPGGVPASRLIDIVDVEMDDGSRRRVAVDSARGYRVGERVRIIGDQLLPEPRTR